jgi:hypothetical protein
MWSILHWLSPEDWSSKTKWIDRMVDTMLNAFGGMMVLGVKPHMEDEFQKTISHHMRRMLKARVLPWLPPVLNDRRDIEMSAKQKKAYEQMRDVMIAELESGEALSAPSVLTQTIRLLQFASSYADIVVDETTGKWVDVVDEDKDTFDIDEFGISWYKAGNLKHPDTPVVLISWISNYRGDDWDENEEQVDATAEDIVSFMRNVKGGFEVVQNVPDRLEEIG